MARSLWEDATPEARAGLRDINTYVGATPGKRTGPGSPGYLAPKVAPERQASIGRRLEAQTQKDIALANREANMGIHQANRESETKLQQARFAQEDKTFERNLATGNFGSRSSGSRSSGGSYTKGNQEDDWKYGGTDTVSGAPTYRTSSKGMQLYIPESVDKKTGVITPGRFGETVGSPVEADAPIMPKEGKGSVTDRPGGLQYSQNVYQRKEKRPDGSDRFVFTNIGEANVARGDRNITNESGSYDREMMNLPWREGSEDKSIAKAAAMEKAGMGKPPVGNAIPAIAPANALTNVPATISTPGGYIPDEPGLAHVEGQFQDTPLYKGSVQIGKGLKDLASDFVAQYEPPKRPQVIPQLGEPGRPAPIDQRLQRKPTFLESRQAEEISKQIKNRYKLINGEWVDTQAAK